MKCYYYRNFRYLWWSQGLLSLLCSSPFLPPGKLCPILQGPRSNATSFKKPSQILSGSQSPAPLLNAQHFVYTSIWAFMGHWDVCRDLSSCLMVNSRQTKVVSVLLCPQQVWHVGEVQKCWVSWRNFRAPENLNMCWKWMNMWYWWQLKAQSCHRTTGWVTRLKIYSADDATISIYLQNFLFLSKEGRNSACDTITVKEEGGPLCFFLPPAPHGPPRQDRALSFAPALAQACCKYAFAGASLKHSFHYQTSPQVFIYTRWA